MVAQENISTVKLISKGKFEKLAKHMDDEVELVLLDEADYYDAPTAVRKLKRALKDLGPGTWKVKHVGGTKGGLSSYSVGIFKVKSNSYRLYIVKEKIDGVTKIVSIELERL